MSALLSEVVVDGGAVHADGLGDLGDGVLSLPGGVVLAGDRRATAGSMIAKRDVEKVFRSDEFSAMGYAGTGSVGIEFVRLFQVELEHYEKMEGRSLSLEGKANRLAWMVRESLQLVDLQYSDVRPERGLYNRLAARGRMVRLTDDATVDRAIDNPPEDTRAYFRGRCLRQYPESVAAASWDSVIFDIPGRESLQPVRS